MIDLGPVKQAQAAWAARPLAERCRLVRSIKTHFARRANDIASVVVAETKKDPTDAWFADVVPNLDLFDYWTTDGAKTLAPESAPISQLKFPKKKGVIHYEPVGLVGLVTPWNYPAALVLRTLVPALVAGNAVLLKPSEVTPRTGQLLAEIFAQVLPRELVTVVQGAGDAGQWVVDQADHIVFIGSVATGKKVAQRAAERLVSVSLELGGKDAAIVLADCDLDRTVAGVFWGAMANSGQNCAAIERCYVERPLYNEFVKRLKQLTNVPIAPVATAAQDQLIRRHLDEAMGRGATVHGSYPGAVILENVPEDALIAREETFGPVLPVWPIDSAEAGIAKANASPYGLSTSIWTKDIARAEALARRADSGMATINNSACSGAMPFAPWSGRRMSGTGVTSSHLAMHELVRPKFVLTDRNTVPEVWWHPFDDEAVQLAKDTAAWLVASGFDKAKRTIGLLSAMKRRVATQVAFFEEARASEKRSGG